MITELKSKISKVLYGDSLKARSSRGMLTLGTGTFIDELLRLVRVMILADLLTRAEFGLMSIVMAASLMLEAFAEVGVRQSVIHHKKGGQQEYLNVAWWFQSIRAVLIYLVAFIIAPWISRFYEQPALTSLLRVGFLTIIFQGLLSPRVYVLEKKIQFGRWVFLYQGSGLFGTLLTLGLAFFVVRNVWALVIGFVAETAFRCVLSFIVCPFFPQFRFHRESLRDLIKYAKRMLGAPLLTIMALHLDIIVLGKTVTADELGMYWLARQLALRLIQLYRKVVIPLLVPVFAEKQDDKDALRRAIKKVTTMASMFWMPVTTFLIACAGPILSLVFSPKDAAVAFPFILLAFYSLVRNQMPPLNSVCFAIGRPDINRRFVTLRLALLVFLLYPAAYMFGLNGAAAVLLAANTVGLYMLIVWMKQTIGLRLGEYVSCWLPGLWLSALTLIPVLVIKLLGYDGVIQRTVVGAVACSVACIIGLLMQLYPSGLLERGFGKNEAKAADSPW